MSQKKEKESRLQSNCVFWLWNIKPDTRGLFFEVNNNPENAIDGARRLAMGMVKGVSDAVFLWHGKAYFFEFKRDVSDKQSEHQKKWQMLVEDHSFNYFLVRKAENFKEIIEWILAGKIL